MLCCSYQKHLLKLIHVNVNIKHIFSTLRSVCVSKGLYTFDRGGQAGTSWLRVAELHVLYKCGKCRIRWMLVLLNEQMMTRLYPWNDHLHKHILRQQQLQRQQINTQLLKRNGYSHIGTSSHIRIFNVFKVASKLAWCFLKHQFST